MDDKELKDLQASEAELLQEMESILAQVGGVDNFRKLCYNEARMGKLKTEHILVLKAVRQYEFKLTGNKNTSGTNKG